LAFLPFSLTSRTDKVSGYKNLSGSVSLHFQSVKSGTKRAGARTGRRLLTWIETVKKGRAEVEALPD
jgi:hypothetical protein